MWDDLPGLSSDGDEVIFRVHMIFNSCLLEVVRVNGKDDIIWIINAHSNRPTMSLGAGMIQ